MSHSDAFISYTGCCKADYESSMGRTVFPYSNGGKNRFQRGCGRWRRRARREEEEKDVEG
ncbi:hypothetical protein ASPWEDRAFT_43675 [Aspergillus wentii DTO 134E9]|uniref:Uncharacterized protein n=1 Tax=Aspergillus wentii DTO 134E9 TaxID=1073089 RepID=A0A1L9R773_ASPWE|nr:uncharacterized protein ASPWEDRAFT_44745 [Aspergillus wentii DTO 134E9]XP_040685397.1 uncharacterized protein ASPWEDRAFT_43675 [Aspergillus wentii DTO 134E9]OJJ30761.1 hypothetical protein ASPWEDRAFT_44745 [Aspergillus wentii DTO 134E9]OJJ31720.1 hypothetical protein ASPWEDRAFT_43675 [Aspergillus wentii DTO 134E9]